MSIDGQQSICQILGHLRGAVVPATPEQMLSPQEVLFNGPGECVCSGAKKKPGSAAKTFVGFLARELHFHFWFLH